MSNFQVVFLKQFSCLIISKKDLKTEFLLALFYLATNTTHIYPTRYLATAYFSQGSYMYVEMDDGVSQGEIARYKSPIITSQDSSGICVRFWYNMYGSDIGDLKVFYIQRDLYSDFLWQRKSSQGPFWIQGEVRYLFCLIFRGCCFLL